MNKQSFNERLRTTWAKHERSFGHRIAPEMREHLQSEIHVQQSSPRTLKDLDGYLKDMMPLLKMAFQQGVSQSGREKLTSGKPRTIRMKSLERRLHLVDFIVNRNSISKGRLRINWKRTVKEWNEAQPLDAMTLPVLKAEYYHALKKWRSATMQRLVASHTIAIKKMMTFPFDSFDVDTLPRILVRVFGVTKQLSGECDAMIQYYEETHLPGQFLHNSIVRLIEMWNQYIETLGQYVKQEVPNEREHKAEKQGQLANSNLHWYGARQ